MNELLEKWMVLKDQERKAKEERENVEAEIYTSLEGGISLDGTTTYHADNLKLTIKQNYSVSVDQEKAELKPGLFKKKYELTWAQYKKLDPSEVDEIVTIKHGKPTFSVEVK